MGGPPVVGTVEALGAEDGTAPLLFHRGRFGFGRLSP